MCSLCGLIGGDLHWADLPARPGVFSRNTGEFERRRERRIRINHLDHIFKCINLKISDWQSIAYVLSDKTGNSEIVIDLGGLWNAAEKLLGHPVDPLSQHFLISLRESRDHV